MNRIHTFKWYSAVLFHFLLKTLCVYWARIQCNTCFIIMPHDLIMTLKIIYIINLCSVYSFIGLCGVQRY